MNPITWEEFKKILNKIDKEHKVKLIPTSQKGRYTTEEKGKRIRFIQPIISMSENDISIIYIHTNDGESYRFSTSDTTKSIKIKSLYDFVLDWLDK